MTYPPLKTVIKNDLFEKAPLFVDLGISFSDQKLLSSIKIKKEGGWNCFTKIDGINSLRPNFLKSHVVSDIPSINLATEIIFNTAQSVIEIIKTETAWVCVRLFLLQ